MDGISGGVMDKISGIADKSSQIRDQLEENQEEFGIGGREEHGVGAPHSQCTEDIVLCRAVAFLCRNRNYMTVVSYKSLVIKRSWLRTNVKETSS